MRKQTKILVATALLALGASFTSMAAAKTGTWMLEDEGWYCYDKEGEAYEDVFCLSYGKEYFMGDDGLMVTSDWVDHEDETYFVGSDGSKTINDWRYVVPQDADDDEEAEWFYFGSKGAMVKSAKKVIDGKTYYFNSDGIMLTGWVDTVLYDEADSITNAVYCDETGARVSKEWVKTWAPDTDLEEAEEDDQAWYWIKSKGDAQTGRNIDINGQTYFFAAEGEENEGQMLSGWVGTYNGEDFFAIGEKNSPYFLNMFNDEGKAVYFCGNSDQGWAKKNTWIKTWRPSEYNADDSDKDQYWFWIAKSGKVYIPTATATNAAPALDVTFLDGSEGGEEAFDATSSNAAVTKEINDKMYAFNTDGEMWSGLVEINGVNYYFGGADDGEMKTGAQMIEDEEGAEWKFFFGKKNDSETDGYVNYTKGAGVTGAANGELYVNGLIQVANGNESYQEKVLDLDGTNYYFVVDGDGDIRTAKKEYKDEDGDVYLDTRDTNVTFYNYSGNRKGSYNVTAE